jgi:hypothetical protein
MVATRRAEAIRPFEDDAQRRENFAEPFEPSLSRARRGKKSIVQVDSA